MQPPLQFQGSREPRTLNQGEIEPLLSDFLMEGWARQRYEVTDVQFAPKTLDATINITNAGTSKNDGSTFYLSNTLVFPIISQLFLIHSLTSLGQKKEFPVWLREYSIETLRRIRKNEGLHFKLETVDRFETRNFKDEGPPGMLVNYIYRFDVDDGAFRGRIWGIFRRPTE